MALNEIREFEWEYYFLNNFYITPVQYENLIYPSAEAAFQAAKCIDENNRRIFQTMSPEEAKKHGRKVQLRPDREEIKLKIMTEILKSKFRDETLKKRLIDTGSATLIEGNNVNDRYWGVDLETGEWENHVGKILMNLRKELIESIKNDK